MTDRRQDFDLLRRFARHGDQAAFADLVRCHLNLVYGTALRKLEDESAAEEVAQNVFAALAHKAWQFAPDDSLPAWLHRTTLLESKQWLRGELRRRRREQTAGELGTTMKTPEEQTALLALVPLLDEALLSLPEKQRSALLLRYFENRSLREVGAAFGVGEDAAQKRVASALERVAHFFTRRGFKSASATATVAALQHTAVSAPAALVEPIIRVALQSAPAAVTGFTAFLSRLAGLTKTQTATLCLVLAGAPIAWQWNQTHSAQRTASALRSTLEASRSQQEQQASQNDRLRSESARIESGLSSLAPQSASRTEEAARKLADLRNRASQLLGASQADWPDDLPFVRVPKWALKTIGSQVLAFGPGGKLAPWIEEVLNLTPDQKSGVESNLGQYLSGIDRLAATKATETNWVSPDGYFHKNVTIPALGEEGQRTENDLATNLVNVLGAQQAKLVMGPLSSINQWIGPERISHALIGSAQTFRVAVRPRESDSPQVEIAWDGHLGYGGPMPEDQMPQFLMDRFQPWLQQIGVTRGVFYHSLEELAQLRSTLK
jgi:RNA polymerase sigma factor (sigma-70 family)